MTPEYIIERLRQVERDYGVRILLAIESGSRAWGFASPDSDWDIRFIYVHPVEWYVTVESGRDVIEIMDGDFDAAGWDLRKALQLFLKTNPSMLEWLRSPIRYIDDGVLAKTLLTLEPRYFNVTRAIYHYFSIAENHNERYMLKNGFTLKRFLYYFRSLLACKWIIERGTPPPVPFTELVAEMVTDRAILSAIDGLLVKKSASKEHDKEDVDPLLAAFALDLSSYVKASLSDNRPQSPPCDHRAELDRLLFDMASSTTVK